MIGKYQLQIGSDQLSTGMASSDYANDGALSPTSTNINPFLTRGAIQGSVDPTDKSTNLVGNPVATSEDSQAVSAVNRVMVDDAANYYTVAADGGLTKRNTGSATTKYIFGKTDIASFALNTYVTLSDDIAKWNTSGFSLTESWWVTTKSKSALGSTVPHPLLVYEGFTWVADGSNLHNWDSSETIVTNALALNGSERIYALGIDPATGLMMMSVQQTVNLSDTLSSKFWVYLFDGYSSKPRRKIPVDDLITAFYSVGGIVYVGYGNRIGYWNGNGISYLRTLANVGYVNTDLPYKHHFSHYGNILLVADGTKILAYGEVLGGKQKGWFYIGSNQVNSTKLGAICHVGAGVICYGWSTPNWYSFDITSASGGNLAVCYSNSIYFPRPVFIRRAVVFTTGITSASGGTGDFAIIDDTGAVNQPPGILGQFVAPTGVTKYRFTFDWTSLKTQSAQFRAILSTKGFGVTRVVIYYDPAE